MDKFRVFTSESVTEGHPDKVCDQISDAILTECLGADKNSRVACECFAGSDFLLIGGEITSKANINYESVAREVIRGIGYNDINAKFNSQNTKIIERVNTQSPDIALGTNDEVNGAGDQGIMFGYACRDTKELMPAPISFAHKLTMELANVRKRDFRIPFKPDGKAQVSVIYDKHGAVVGIDTVVVSTQHYDTIEQGELRDIVIDTVIEPVLGQWISEDTRILVNPTGRFVIGGPEGDTGLTGRKIIVDTYGGAAAHGGGAFSGKDPTKVDRSAAYMARLIAKSIVANGMADKCEVQLAYAIGVSEPVSIHVNTFGTSNTADSEFCNIIRKNFPLDPAGMIEFLDLKNVDYRKVAAYGHFGREDLGVKWEKPVEL